MGVGRFLLDLQVITLIWKARLYWNPLRTQKLLFPFMVKFK